MVLVQVQRLNISSGNKLPSIIEYYPQIRND